MLMIASLDAFLNSQLLLSLTSYCKLSGSIWEFQIALADILKVQFAVNCICLSFSGYDPTIVAIADRGGVATLRIPLTVSQQC